MFRVRAVLVCSLVALTVLGCEDLDNFRTHRGEAYSGDVVGSDSTQGKDSFIRQGFASHTKMDLTFDPALASEFVPADAGSSAATAPGTIHTYVCPAAHPDCNAKSGKSSLFAHAKLERITNLTNDALAQYDFPGGGRLRNYLFFARTDAGKDGSLTPRAATVFISLMEDEHIEVRVIAPNVLADDGKTEVDRPLFGVFVLKRHSP
jgi:hypothetical protein